MRSRICIVIKRRYPVWSMFQDTQTKSYLPIKKIKSLNTYIPRNVWRAHSSDMTAGRDYYWLEKSKNVSRYYSRSLFNSLNRCRHNVEKKVLFPFHDFSPYSSLHLLGGGSFSYYYDRYYSRRRQTALKLETDKAKKSVRIFGYDAEHGG